VSTSYWNYIKVEELLAIQNGSAGDESELSNEEVLFITVHQIHELWFKLVLRDLSSTRDLFLLDVVPETSLATATRSLRRSSRVLRFAADHFGLVETMTTRDFLDFRDKLSPASGYQSAQFREIELLLGLKAEERIPFGEDTTWLDVLREEDGSHSPASRRVEARMQEKATLKSAVEGWLYRTPIDGSKPDQAGDEQSVRQFLEQFLTKHAEEMDAARSHARFPTLTPRDLGRLERRFEGEKQSARDFLLCEDPRQRRLRASMLFVESYRELPLLAWPREILDLLIDIEQAWLIFRQRHARMVERMIGRRIGTGGSDGVGYLDETALRYRVFPDLWQIRTILVRTKQIPELHHREQYLFRADDE